MALGSEYMVPGQLTACRLMTTGNLNATYSSIAPGSGVGARLTNAGSFAPLVIDTVAVNVNDRIAVVNQTLSAQDGIYEVLDVGSSITPWILVRSYDMQSLGQFKAGSYLTIGSGNINLGEVLIICEPLPYNIGIQPIIFQAVSTGASAGTVGPGVANQVATYLVSGNAVNGSNILKDATGNDVLDFFNRLIYSAAGQQYADFSNPLRVAIGEDSGTISQSNNAVAIGVGAGKENQGDGAISLGLNAGNTAQGTNSIAIGNSASFLDQAINSISIGTGSETPLGVNAIAIGNVAIAAGGSSVAIGDGAGAANSFGIAIGSNAGNETTQGINGIAIGNSAGNISQGPAAIAMGNQAGINTQGNSAIAIGNAAGTLNQGAQAIAMSTNAGASNQGQSAIAIGTGAGQTSQATQAIAIGLNAGNSGQLTNCIAIGTGATNNAFANSIALGSSASNTAAAQAILPIGVTWDAGSLPPGGLQTDDATSSSQALQVQNRYITDNGAGLVTYTLPATASLGATIKILGKSSGGWTIHQNAGQQIQLGSSGTTVGVGGSLSSSNQWDNVVLECVTAGASTVWTVSSVQGNLTVV